MTPRRARGVERSDPGRFCISAKTGEGCAPLVDAMAAAVALDRHRVTVELDPDDPADAERLRWVFRHGRVVSQVTVGRRTRIDADVPRRLSAHLQRPGLAPRARRQSAAHGEGQCVRSADCRASMALGLASCTWRRAALRRRPWCSRRPRRRIPTSCFPWRRRARRRPRSTGSTRGWRLLQANDVPRPPTASSRRCCKTSGGFAPAVSRPRATWNWRASGPREALRQFDGATARGPRVCAGAGRARAGAARRRAVTRTRCASFEAALAADAEPARPGRPDRDAAGARGAGPRRPCRTRRGRGAVGRGADRLSCGDRRVARLGVPAPRSRARWSARPAAPTRRSTTARAAIALDPDDAAAHLIVGRHPGRTQTTWTARSRPTAAPPRSIRRRRIEAAMTRVRERARDAALPAAVSRASPRARRRPAPTWRRCSACGWRPVLAVVAAASGGRDRRARPLGPALDSGRDARRGHGGVSQLHLPARRRRCAAPTSPMPSAGCWRCSPRPRRRGGAVGPGRRSTVVGRAARPPGVPRGAAGRGGRRDAARRRRLRVCCEPVSGAEAVERRGAADGAGRGAR